MENYLMLNGKRIDLTAEQIETLVGKKEKDPFVRFKGGEYLYIDSDGKIEVEWDEMTELDNERFAVGNHCADEELMKQRRLHEILNRVLWRYSMQHGGREIAKGNGNFKYSLSCIYQKWQVNPIDSDVYIEGTISFKDMGTAEAAIEEIVKPFMEKHPEFRW